MKVVLFVCVMLLSHLLLATSRDEYRDREGRLQGTAREKQDRIEYRFFV
jgi:hypothetical protein